MALHRTDGIVMRRRNLGESDRIVEFYTHDYGKVRGVARGVRRPRSRFGSALETFTLGRLLFFDTGRSELVRVDHFDILHSFVAVREHLDRLGRGAWVLECVDRLSGERDPHPALYGLLVRALRAFEGGAADPERVAACFALRAVDLLGHRPRIDRCVGCGRVYPFPEAALDVEMGGLLCQGCGPTGHGLAVSGTVVGTLKRFRTSRWDEALRVPLAPDLAADLSLLVDAIVVRLAGHPSRSGRFLAQTRRGLAMVSEPRGPFSAR